MGAQQEAAAAQALAISMAVLVREVEAAEAVADANLCER
jgi:hypothetical protein